MTSTHPIPATRGERSWTAAEQEAYLDSRPVGGPYNPAADYGDPDWREPESDEEAAARTAHLDTQPRDPHTQEWVARVAEISKREQAAIDAGIELEHARATHDPDEIAEADERYRAALEAVEAELAEPEPNGEEVSNGEANEDERGDLTARAAEIPEPELDEEAEL